MINFKKYINYSKEIGLLQTIGLFINFIFFKLDYKELEDKSGYFLVKRKFVWFVFTPILLPIYLLFMILQGICDYFKYVNSFYHHWINRAKGRLTLDEKIIYRRNLWD